MSAYAARKLNEIRRERQQIESNIAFHKKALPGAKDGLKKMYEESIATDGDRVEVLRAIEKAIEPLAGAAPSPEPPPPK